MLGHTEIAGAHILLRDNLRELMHMIGSPMPHGINLGGIFSANGSGQHRDLFEISLIVNFMILRKEFFQEGLQRKRCNICCQCTDNTSQAGHCIALLLHFLIPEGSSLFCVHCSQRPHGCIFKFSPFTLAQIEQKLMILFAHAQCLNHGFPHILLAVREDGSKPVVFVFPCQFGNQANPSRHFCFPGRIKVFFQKRDNGCALLHQNFCNQVGQFSIIISQRANNIGKNAEIGEIVWVLNPTFTD